MTVHESIHLPKVDQTKDHAGHDGKVGKVETKRGSRRDGKGNMVSRADHTIEGDGSSDDDVSDRTEISMIRCLQDSIDLHGDGCFTPRQSQRNDRTGLLHRTDVGSIGQPQEQVIDTILSA